MTRFNADAELARIATHIQRKAALFSNGDSFLVDIDPEDVVTLAGSLVSGDFWRFLDASPQFVLETASDALPEPSWEDYVAAQVVVDKSTGRRSPHEKKIYKRGIGDAPRASRSDKQVELFLEAVFGSNGDIGFAGPQLHEEKLEVQAAINALARKVACAKQIATIANELQPLAVVQAFSYHRRLGMGPIADWVIYDHKQKTRTELASGRFSTEDLILLTLIDGDPAFEERQVASVRRIVAISLADNGRDQKKRRRKLRPSTVHAATMHPD